MKGIGDKPPNYIDTPTGIFTSNGTWFRTTETLLADYADELLQRESVEALITATEVWLRVPMNTALWMMPLFLWYYGPIVAMSAIILIFIVLSVIGPYYTSHNGFFIANFLNGTLLQALLYLIFLSYVFQLGLYAMGIVGIFTFVLLRWGLVSKGLTPVILWLNKRIYSIPYNDKMLKSVIVKKSMKYRIGLQEISAIELSIMKKIQSR